MGANKGERASSYLELFYYSSHSSFSFTSASPSMFLPPREERSFIPLRVSPARTLSCLLVANAFQGATRSDLFKGLIRGSLGGMEGEKRGVGQGRIEYASRELQHCLVSSQVYFACNTPKRGQ